jgi:kinesin family protein 11
MISKKTLLREFTAEIEKLKGELIATRQRNGVYLSNENYEEITVESESRRILSEEQRAKIETMEANLRNKVQELFSLTNNFAVLKKDNESTRQILDETTEILGKTEIVLANTRQNLADETLLRKAHQATEEELSTKGGELISTLDKTVKDVGGLHAKLRRRSDLQSVNRSKWTSTQSRVTDVTQLVESKVVEFQASQNELLSTMSSHVLNFVEQELQAIAAQQEALVSASDTFKVSETKLVGQASGARDEMNEVLEEIKVLRENVKRKVGEGLQGLSTAARRISGEVIGEMDRFHNQVCRFSCLLVNR